MSNTVLYAICGVCAVVLAVILICVAKERGWRAFGFACLAAVGGALAGVLVARLLEGA